jgi:hypothetical protein
MERVTPPTDRHKSGSVARHRLAGDNGVSRKTFGIVENSAFGPSTILAQKRAQDPESGVQGLSTLPDALEELP